MNLVITHSQHKINTMKNKEMFKKLVYLTSLAGIGLFLNSCATGYVATEPSYVEYSRPQRPSDLHIWVNGDWAFNLKHMLMCNEMAIGHHRINDVFM